MKKLRKEHISSRKSQMALIEEETETSQNGKEDEDGMIENDPSDTDTDIDEPRAVQWEGLDDEMQPETHESEDKGEGPSKPVRSTTRDDISSLSFGSLLKARRILDRARTENDDDSDSDDEPVEYEATDQGSGGDAQARSEEKREMKRPRKRRHKHEPIEMMSKRPVTRKRQVVEVRTVNYRDPRFTSAANDDVRETFRKRYSFLESLHKTELQELKDNLRRARQRLRTVPRDRRKEWEEEVERLERAYKRGESLVNRDHKEAVERQTLERALKEEKDRRKAGKGEWYMKKSVRKELLLKARHDALAEKGGGLAVRKAIEKRQKKIHQKEKRQRPSFAGREEDTEGRRSNESQQSTVR